MNQEGFREVVMSIWALKDEVREMWLLRLSQ